MVAWHGVPGKCGARIRPGGYGMMSYPEGHLCPLVGLRPGKFEGTRRMRHLETALIPYPPGRIRVSTFPRHFVPGYLHSVPPGQS
jgi:hypothetical protein